jgi:hypothetical protein
MRGGGDGERKKEKRVVVSDHMMFFFFVIIRSYLKGSPIQKHFVSFCVVPFLFRENEHGKGVKIYIH